jgi:DNA adenine methylase
MPHAVRMYAEHNGKKKSFLNWLGGKSLLADQIIPLILPHHCYVEPFAGGAWVLFKKPPSRVEVLNDINLDLVTLFRVVQNHPEELLRQLNWTLVARADFERHLAADPATLTDIQRAARFYYLMRAGYGADVVSPRFSVGTMRPSNLNVPNIKESLMAAHQRLARAYIENRPYGQIIDRYDGPSTFFYLDPPYFNREHYYGKGIFERADFERLAHQLQSIKGKFILSLNDVPDVRRIFARFTVTEISTRYRIGSADPGKPVHELLIFNYEPDQAAPVH